MFSICKQTHPSTAIEYCITCYFYNRREKCLITAGANVLKVFRIIPDVEPGSKEKYSYARPPKMRLECLASFQLFGNIMSLQSVRLSGSQTDALLLSFREAKLAIVQMDMITYSLRTLSLHYFEDSDIKNGWTNCQHIPTVRVDPDNRCAVMLIYGNKLVVLPFHRDSLLDEMDSMEAKPVQNPVTGGSGRCSILASYMIELKELDEKIDNVIDIQFLHGYYEPTLNILYEPVKTFPGRIAVRTDTCCMAAISINVQQRVHPIIWSLGGLPYDCCQIIAVPKPIGGCLVLAVNSMIYLNQSVPPYGVSLNNIADHSTNFPLKPQDNVRFSLERACCVFISPERLVLSVSSGELYVVSLFADSMRSVRGLHFARAASSVLTTCICVVEDGYLFLGSRLGNSLLLRFTEKDQNTVISIDDDEVEESSAKKRRLDNEDPQMFGDLEFEVYGTETKTAMQLTSYVFEVCDSLLNIGPVGSVAPGEPALTNDELTGPDPDIELVTTSGHGKNGALCVLQRSVKQHIITTFTLRGVLDMWTVMSDDKMTENEASHSFMILSHDTTTMILKTGSEINEIDDTGFQTRAPTVFAGNLGNCKYIVQVTTRSIRLLQGSKLLQNIPLDLGCSVIQACISDPYLCILSEQGQVITLALRDVRGNARLVNNKNSIGAVPRVLCMSLYRDLSGLFSNVITDYDDISSTSTFSSRRPNKKPSMKPENEDDLLYADATKYELPTLADMAQQLPASTMNTSWWRKHLQEVKPTYWLFIVRDTGNVEIYSMPELRLNFLIRHAAQGLKMLVDSMESVPLIKDVVMFQEQSFGSTVLDYGIKEILMVALGNHGSRPTLIIRLDHEILLYQVYKYPKGNLKLRFRKINHSIILPKPIEAETKVDAEDMYSRSKQYLTKMRYFSNIAGYNGVFLAGINPIWLFLTARGEVRTHPMSSDGPIETLAAFNNVNCPSGFVYLNSKSELRICVLPTHISYDAPWPVRKVPLRCTAHFVVYNMESKTYCVVTSQSQPSQSYYKFNGEDKELSEENKGERFIYPMQDKFSMCLFSPVSWEVIPNTKTEFDDWEHITCLKNVALAYEGTTSGLKGYIALGSNYNYSEDITSRGRILIYDIIEVVPEPGQPLTKNRFKLVYSKDQKGPVTAITQVVGFLVSAVGQKIYLWQLKDNDLVGVAFIDTQIYIHQMLSIKSLILVADVYKSISLLRFQDEFRTLSLVSRDYRPAEIYSIEYLVDNSTLGFLVSDADRNLVTYMYQPESRESCGGQKLLRKADYHLGQHVNAFFRIRCKIAEGVDSRKHFSGSDRRHITMFATLDGGLGYVMPLPEKCYRRLFLLQNAMMMQTQQIAGLNPKAHRTYRSSRKLHANPARCIIDGDLVTSYVNLTASDKLEVAKKIGSRMEDILYDLSDIDRMTAHF